MTERIDAHQHFWTLARGDYGWLNPELGPLYADFGPDDLRPLVRAAGVERTVLVQAAPTAAETQFLLELAAREPFVAGVVGWVDFEAGDAPAQIEALAGRDGAVGVRPMIQDIKDPGWMLSPAVARAFRAVAETGLAFDALIQPRHLGHLLTLLERHPRLRTIIDHGAKPDIAGGEFSEWAAAIGAVARETDALCKMSGLLTECGADASLDALRPYLDHLFLVFGPDRIVWGSDWPVVLLRAEYDEWHSISRTYLGAISAEDRQAVLGGNAARFYRL